MSSEILLKQDIPQIEIRLTRDSVCAGDDVDAPHEKLLVLPTFEDPADFINHTSSGYLPGLSGTIHNWECLLNGNHIGTITPKKIISIIDEIAYDEENIVHFKYN